MRLCWLLFLLLRMLKMAKELDPEVVGLLQAFAEADGVADQAVIDSENAEQAVLDARDEADVLLQTVVDTRAAKADAWSAFAAKANEVYGVDLPAPEPDADDSV